MPKDGIVSFSVKLDLETYRRVQEAQAITKIFNRSEFVRQAVDAYLKILLKEKS